MADTVIVTSSSSTITVTIDAPPAVTVTSPTVSPVIITAGGPKGDTGATGPAGADGADGAPGVGVPAGGTTGESLLKASDTDYDTEWGDPLIDTVYFTIKNVSGGELPKGTPVHAVFADISGNVVPVIAADASIPSSMPCNFILNETVADEAEGQALLIGYIQGVNTDAFDVGDVVYVDSGGGYTNSKPTGTDLIQNLGIVVKSHPTNGSGVVYGAGRSNDTPNLPTGKFFIGSATNTQESAYTLPTADGTANQFLKTDGAGAVTFTSITQATGNELENVVEDTTPQLGGTLDSNGNEIRFRGAGHSNYVAIAPSTLEPGASVTFYPPIADGTTGQVIQTNGSGRLSFTTVTSATGNELENVVEDTTPQLGGDLDAQSNSITNLGNINGTAASTIISGAAAGATALQDVVDDTTPQLGGTLDSNGSEVRFRGSGHTNYVALAPSTIEPGSSVTYVLPTSDGTVGQVIQTNGSGKLSFTDQTDTTYTAGDGLDLAGTEFSADLKANGGIVVESTELAVDLGASSITGTLAIGDGGTGQTTQQAALDAITNASSGTTGQVLTTDGTNASWQTASGGGGSNKTAYIFHYADTGTSSKFFVADTLAEISSEDYRTRTPMVEAGEITKAMIATNATTPSGNDYRLNIYLNGVATYSANATADTVAGDGRIQFTFSSATVSAGDVVSFRISGTASATASLPVSIGSAVLCVIKQDS